MPDPKGNLVTPVAFDAADDPRSLTVDAADNLNVNLEGQTADIDVNIAAQDADVEIVQQDPADLRVGEHGYIGGAWQKNPLLLGYSGHIDNQISVLNTGENPTIAQSPVVPAGELWRVESFIGWHNDAGALLFYVEAFNGTVPRPVGRHSALATNVSLAAPNTFTLAEGHSLRCRTWGAGVGSWVYIAYWITRIDIDL